LKVKKAAVRACVLVAMFLAVLLEGSGCRAREEEAASVKSPQDHSQKSFSSSLSPFVSLSFDEALERARTEKKLVFVDFSAAWCSWCTKMDEDVFPDARVKAALLEYVPIQLDTDNAGGRAVAERYRVNGLPAYLLVNGNGELVAQFDGYMPVDVFLARLRRTSGAGG
jgi:thiol:disulfide interchange protein